jgi:hypothetical protein
MLSIELDPDSERRLKALAKRTGKTEVELARELVEHNLEDLEEAGSNDPARSSAVWLAHSLVRRVCSHTLASRLFRGLASMRRVATAEDPRSFGTPLRSGRPPK